MAATTYFHGSLAKYTGRTEDAYGQTWYEVRLTEGHLIGCTRLVSKPPEYDKEEPANWPNL